MENKFWVRREQSEWLRPLQQDFKKTYLPLLKKREYYTSIILNYFPANHKMQITLYTF